MEARASFSGSPVSKTFVAGILVLVAMGLAAMGGYVAKGLTSSGAAASQNVSVHAAPGTVLRQDRESKAGAELPGYILQEITPRPAPRYIQDDPYFIAQFAGTGQKADRTPHTGYRELA
jgi:hypothetical protein